MLAAIGRQFALEGEYVCGRRYGGGHIHETYFVTYRTAGRIQRYVHQRINRHVFPNTRWLHENIAIVTEHLRAKLAARGVGEIDRRVLRIVPTREGDNALHTAQGECWRTYLYINDTLSKSRVRTPSDAYSAARAFGEFAAGLADVEIDRLHETIPNFHDTPMRFAQLLQSIEEDPWNRAASARQTIADALRCEPLCRTIQQVAASAAVPVRAAHNDTKVTNVLFDRVGREAICVVDLDTVMPGLTLHDVGELVRTASTRAAEDEQDLSRVIVDAELFEALARGFVAGSGDLCTPAERRAFVTAGEVLAFENAVRFLADHLKGDRYFRIHRPGQNLDRARAQLALAASLNRQRDELERRLERAWQAA